MNVSRTVAKIIGRDLNKLKTEIEKFETDAGLWQVTGEVPNTAGTLCLHLCGNLSHFIGAVLGNSGYVRDRDAEFSLTGLSQQELVRLIEETRAEVARAFEQLSDASLDDEFPFELKGEPVTAGYFLLHLTTHLNYHLGQINYLRRALASPDLQD